MDETTRTLGDRYEVGDILGRGGMAEVHLGRDSRLGRTVAIKLLRSDMARDPVFHARFRREAQSAAGMNHPSIVAVYDTGEDVRVESGGAQVKLPYIVMEHVAGRTLRDLLIAAGGDGLGTERAVTITAGVLTALDYSHQHGIVHRDIKPANVMVTPAGDVKVMDFGIARAIADSSATMTATSAVIGTAQYLSPEQARGQVVDARTDLYSTGCLLYELLTGRPPFLGDSAVSVAYQHVLEVPAPPSSFNPAIDDRIDRVVLKALAKDREDRYASAGDFRADLLAGAAGHTVEAPAVSVAAATQAVPTTTEATRSLAAAGFVVTGAGRGGSAASGAPAGFAGSGSDTGPMQWAGGSGQHPSGQMAALDPGAPTGPFSAVPASEEEPQGPSRRTVYRWLVPILVVALLAAVCWWVFAASRRVDVPRVTGSSQSSAVATLKESGLGARETRKADKATSGTVIAQRPKAGATTTKGALVRLTVSSGPAAVAVPDVAGMTEVQAFNRLKGVGLIEGTLTPKDDPGTPSGRMVSSDPPAGTKVARGTVVALVASNGQVSLPDLTKQTSQAAQQTLTTLGLVPFVTPRTTSAVPAGRVIDQSPQAGLVDAGSPVTLVVSQAPAPAPAPSSAAPSPTQAPTTAAPTTTATQAPTTSPTDDDPATSVPPTSVAPSTPAGAQVLPGSPSPSGG